MVEVEVEVEVVVGVVVEVGVGVEVEVVVGVGVEVEVVVVIKMPPEKKTAITKKEEIMPDQAQDLRDLLQKAQSIGADHLNRLFDELVIAIKATTQLESIDLLTLEFDPNLKHEGDRVHISISGLDEDDSNLRCSYSAQGFDFVKTVNKLVEDDCECVNVPDSAREREEVRADYEYDRMVDERLEREAGTNGK